VVSSRRDGLGREESERLRGENIRQIRENTQRVRGVWGKEQSLWGGSDKKGLGEELGTSSPLLLFRLNPSRRSILLPALPEPFAYSPRFGRRNQGRTGYHGKKGGGQECVGEGWE